MTKDVGHNQKLTVNDGIVVYVDPKDCRTVTGSLAKHIDIALTKKHM